MATAPPLQERLERAHQVFRFLLQLHVAVAQHAKRALALHVEAGEQLRDEHADQLLELNEAKLRRLRRLLHAQPDEALELARDRDEPAHGLRIAFALHPDDHREPEVRNERERMGGIDGDRREDRKDVREEQALQPRLLGRRETGGLDDLDTRRGHVLLDLVPARLFVRDELSGEAIDLHELLLRRQAVLGQRRDPGRDLAVDARRAHHVEFVEVGRRDRQEAELLQQRVAAIRGLFHHAPVELQPRKLAIVEPGRTFGHGSCGNRRACFHFLLTFC